MDETKLLEQLAQDNQSLKVKCEQLESQLIAQKSESWIVFLVELSLLFGLGLFIGNFWGNWQGYDRGVNDGRERWLSEYCQLKFPKDVKEYNNCRD